MSADAPAIAERVIAAIIAGDQAARALGIVVVAVASERVALAMTVSKAMLNAHGVAQGGVIFTLADTAFACACNADNVTTVAAGADIDFVASARLGDVLTAEATTTVQRARLGLYDVSVRAADDRLIAFMRGRAYRVGGEALAAIAAARAGR